MSRVCQPFFCKQLRVGLLIRVILFDSLRRGARAMQGAPSRAPSSA